MPLTVLAPWTPLICFPSGSWTAPSALQSLRCYPDWHLSHAALSREEWLDRLIRGLVWSVTASPQSSLDRSHRKALPTVLVDLAVRVRFLLSIWSLLPPSLPSFSGIVLLPGFAWLAYIFNLIFTSIVYKVNNNSQLTFNGKISLPALSKVSKVIG